MSNDVKTPKARSHRDLVVWNKAMDVADTLCEVACSFPKHQLYVLTSQLMRAATSVPANIAEGNARGTRRDYAHFISIARGSLAEAETFVLIGLRRGYIKEPAVAPVLDSMAEVGRMLTALHARLCEPSNP